MPVGEDAQKDAGGEEEEALDEDSAEESGSDESGDSGDDDESDEEKTPPPPIDLPDRSTRGKRLRATIAEEEENADNDFWKQDFFAEEGVDGEYSADSNSEDSGDSDFSDPEEEDNEDDGTEEALRSVLKLKKPKEKPPGAKQAALRKAAQARAKKQREEKAAAAQTGQPAAKKEVKKVRFTEPAEAASAPSLRRSTKVRTAATISAEKQRASDAQMRRPAASRAKQKEAPTALCMMDVLRRAAADQLANQASLQALIVKEADEKAKAMQKASAARGPRVRWRYYTDVVPGHGAKEQQDRANGALPEAPALGGLKEGEGSLVKKEGVEDVKEEGGDGKVEEDKCTRVGRCTLAFVEMTPDTVPPEYRHRSLNSIVRPPSDMCVKSDGSMQQRVRALTPQEKAQTACEPSAQGPTGSARSSRLGCASASSIGDRMLGAVDMAIRGKLRTHYGEMSRVVESVDGFQGTQDIAAQEIAALCGPDSLRGMQGGATAGVDMYQQTGGRVGGLDMSGASGSAIPGTIPANGMPGKVDIDSVSVGGVLGTAGWTGGNQLNSYMQNSLIDNSFPHFPSYRHPASNALK